MTVQGAPDYAWLTRWLDENEEDVIQWRRHLHAHPELGNVEYATTEFVRSILESAGLAPRVLSSGTGVVCDIGSSGPIVALRADLDALPIQEDTGLEFASRNPNAMHACGHDVHTASLLGAAVALSQAPHLEGRVRLIFQAAEELMTGALAAIDDGVLDDVERIFMIHVSPQLRAGTVGSRAGAITSSSDAITVRFSSPGGHSSAPHTTGDLISALGRVIEGLPALISRRVNPHHAPVLVWGHVESGFAANVIPTSGILRGTLRVNNRHAWDDAPALVSELIDGLLAGTNVSHELDYQRGVPPVENDPESRDIAQRAVALALGAENYEDVGQGGGGEDFAYYLADIPGAYVSLGVWDDSQPQTGVHGPRFHADERSVRAGAHIYATLALEALAVATKECAPR